MNVRAQEASERIKKDTGGKFDLQVFPNSQLGSDTDMLSQVRSGGIEFFTLSPSILSTLVPDASISGIAFAFPTTTRCGRRWTATSASMCAAQIAKANLVAMSRRCWDNGFRQITSSTKPIETPDDLKGFKIRVPVEPAMDLDVQGASAPAPTADQLLGDLLGPADQGRRRPGEPARHHRHGASSTRCRNTAR